MNYIQSIFSFSSFCVNSLKEEFRSESPLFSRFEINWRDNIMLYGLISSIFGIVFSVVQGLTIFVGLFTVIAVTISIGMYYVSCYSKLRPLEHQVVALERVVQELHDLNPNIVELTQQKDILVANVAALNGEVTALTIVRNQLQNISNSMKLDYNILSNMMRDAILKV